ncbi:MAG: hypothetical protein QOJ04_5164, partial [Caballeronia sp.]|nr:hypothetical protein [Caballeronia sp.]
MGAKMCGNTQVFLSLMAETASVLQRLSG